MSENQNDVSAFVQQQAEAAVASGQHVRAQVSQLVADTAEKFHSRKEGLLGLTQSALDGAIAAVNRAVPANLDSTLRQVVDGLGDGLSAVALAGRLAVEEANAQRQRFASEDLAKLNQDLHDLGCKFVDTVSTTAQKFRTMTQAQLATLREHATATLQRIQPTLEGALSAARKHPLQLGKESVVAGITFSRQTLGALFGAVGRSLQEAGKRLAGD